MNLYQSYEVSTLHEVDFPACNNPTTIEDAFDAAARKQADNWLTYNYEGEFMESYEGCQDKYNYVVQPSHWGVD
jgi:hypothetical protein